MELREYEKSKPKYLNFIDPVILEKSGLINECKWARGIGTKSMPHMSETSKCLELFTLMKERRS